MGFAMQLYTTGRAHTCLIYTYFDLDELFISDFRVEVQAAIRKQRSILDVSIANEPHLPHQMHMRVYVWVRACAFACARCASEGARARPPRLCCWWQAFCILMTNQVC